MGRTTALLTAANDKHDSQVSRTTISALDPGRRRQVIATLTKPRLGKYLYATHHDEHQALRLYVLNTQVSAAFLADLHYVEIALRNKFDVELTAAFGECWFQAPAFLALLDRRNWDILQKAQREAAKHRPQGQAVG